LIVVVVAILLLRPLVMVTLVIALTIACEASVFGLFTFTYALYGSITKDLTILDALVGLAVLSVALDMMRHRRRLRVPGPLRLFLLFLALAMVGSAVMSHATGTSVHFAILSEHTLAYLLVLPTAVANLRIDKQQLRYLLVGAMGIAIVKALLGIVEVVTGHGAIVEGSGRLTYYEPTANWVIMMGLFSVLAALVIRAKPSLWLLIGGAVLFGSLLLSYRRSFWIAAVVGIALILLVGMTPAGRRLLLPVVLSMVAGVWVLSTVPFQASGQIVKRATSLTSSKVEANKYDRYRIDERINVLANIREHPITGLGIDTPWKAIVRPLSIESAGQGGYGAYVHFAVLWYWVKLGVVGLLAYLSLLAGTAVLAWRVWRRSEDSVLRVFGLASLCGIAGLVVAETTASFTGTDPRMSLIVAAQAGLLALAARMNQASSIDLFSSMASGPSNSGGEAATARVLNATCASRASPRPQ
jgi:O-antigen ligase